MTLDAGGVTISTGSSIAFYVASTNRIYAGNYSGIDPEDGVVTLLGPSRYVNSEGGLFGHEGSTDISW